METGALVSVVVSLKIRNANQLDQTARAINEHGNAQFGKFLTNDQFLERHAPTAAQAQAVADYLRKSGFVNINIAPNRLLISADGTAGTVKAAFNTSLMHMQVNGQDAHANTASAQVPSELGDVVLSVLGLQTVSLPHQLYSVYSGTVTPLPSPLPIVDFLTGHNPTDFPGIYDIGNTPTAANTTVGIIAVGGVTIPIQELSTFTTQNNLSPVNVKTVQSGSGDFSDQPSGDLEWDLDSQTIVGAAGGTVKQLIFYTSANASGNAGLIAALNRAVSDNLAKVINVSLGMCEADAYNDGTMSTADQIFESAVAQGQTFVVASGDGGVYECNTGVPNGSTYTQSYPATSPYVIAVGGTRLITTLLGDPKYVGETVWNEGYNFSGSRIFATGGGVSAYESAPSWQSALSVTPLPAGRRALPDISFDAAPVFGARIYYSGTNLIQLGGTSLSAPLFAGFWARLQSANSNVLPFPASGMYKIFPANPSLVHDITVGNNGYGLRYGYNAGVGWDYPTGWGSIDMAKLYAYTQKYGF
jgi:pseudomonalisin